MMTFSSATNVELARRIDDDLAAGQPLADVVVGVAFQRQRHARAARSAEALAGRALEVQLDRVVRQALRRRSGASPRCRAIVPTTRLMLRIGNVARTGSPRSRAGRHRASSVVSSSDLSRPWSCGLEQ